MFNLSCSWIYLLLVGFGSVLYGRHKIPAHKQNSHIFASLNLPEGGRTLNMKKCKNLVLFT